MRYIRLCMALLLVVSLVTGNGLVTGLAAAAGNNGNGAGNTNPASLDVSVEAAQSEIAKPADGPAQGAFNITLTPRGTVTDTTRQPVDVVFVVDKSGSMNDKIGSGKKSKSKMDLAKDAVQEAVNLFKSVNAGAKNIGDRLALVPFDSDIVEANKAVYTLTTNANDAFQKIVMQKVTALDAEGGTNYTTSLDKARQILQSSPNRKYVVFLTDGFPTFSKKNVLLNGKYYYYDDWDWFRIWKKYVDVNGEREVHYELYTNGDYDKYFENNGKTLRFDNTTYESVQNEIIQHGREMATELAKANVKLYSIGFGDIGGKNKEVDLDYLQSLSAITGAVAQHGTADNLSSVFRSITDDINRLALSEVQLKVRIKDQQLKDRVRLAAGAKAYVDGDYAVINMNDVPYTVGGPTPSPQSYMLPLEFLETGNYVFNDMTLTYRYFDGTVREVKNIHPVHIKVVDKQEPTFQATMSYGSDVSGLVKSVQTNLNNNVFDIRYSIAPIGDLDKSDQGQLSNVTLVQHLPKGITVVNSGDSFVRTSPEADGTRAEITFDPVNINNGVFQPSTGQTRTLRVSVDWALNERLQNPLLQYSYKGEQKSIAVEAPLDPVKLTVKLHDDRGFTYEANEAGQIRKVADEGNTAVDAVTLEQDGRSLVYPVTSMAFKENTDNTVVLVTYRNVTENRDLTAELPLVPSLVITEKLSGRSLASGAVSSGPAIVSIDRLVPDSGGKVSYKYRVTKGSSAGSWQSLTDPYRIELADNGVYTVEVQATGGFAVDKTVRVSVTVQSAIPVTGVTVSPANVNLQVGERTTLTATVTPSNATNRSVTWQSSNPDVATVDESGTVTGVRPGTATITVTSVDNPSKSATSQVTVVDQQTQFLVFYDAQLTQPVTDVSNWLDRDVYVKLVFPDSFATSQRVYTINNGDPTAYTGPILINREGVTTIGYKARASDNDWTEQTIKIDKSGPVVTISGGTVDAVQKVVKGITITATDTNPIDHIDVWTSVGGNKQTLSGAMGTYDTPVINQGSVTVYAQAVDSLGKAGQVASKTYTLDDAPPSIIVDDSFIRQATKNDDNRYISLAVNVTDDVSGVDKVEYKVIKLNISGDTVSDGSTVTGGTLTATSGSLWEASDIFIDGGPGFYKVVIDAYDKVYDPENEQTKTRHVAQKWDVFFISPGYRLAAVPTASATVSNKPIVITLQKDHAGISYFASDVAEPSDTAKLRLGTLFDANRNMTIDPESAGDWDWHISKIEYAVVDVSTGTPPVINNWLPLKSSQIVITGQDKPYEVYIRITDNYTRRGGKQVVNTYKLSGTFVVSSKLKKL